MKEFFNSLEESAEIGDQKERERIQMQLEQGDGRPPGRPTGVRSTERSTNWHSPLSIGVGRPTGRPILPNFNVRSFYIWFRDDR